MLPTYAISLTAAIYHPLDEVMVASFERDLINSSAREANEFRTTLSLSQLDYRSEQSSMLQVVFDGSIRGLAFTVPYIELRGTVDYQSDPSNGHIYREDITFQRVYLRHAELSLELISTTFEMTTKNLLVVGEEALCRATVSNIINFEPALAVDLVVLMEVNGTYLNITSINVIHTG